jgi:hypothetical protein
MGSVWVSPNHHYEILCLQLAAKGVGWEIVQPPFRRGKSGDDQWFSFLAKDGKYYCGFDIREDVCEKDVQNVYNKSEDADVYPIIVNMRGRPAERLARFANNLGITIFSPAEIESFFESVGMETIPRKKPRKRKSVA